MAIDLHIHSTVSDGTQSPAEIVSTALAMGLSAIALADHDSVSGVAEAQRLASGTALRVISAVEVNTDIGDREAHILGYLVDIGSPTLQQGLEMIRRARLERADEMVSRLNGLGVAITMSDVMAVCAGDSVGRPHIARALVARRCCSSESEAFERYLKVGRPAYVPRYRLSTSDAIELIAGAGGMAVLAHPLLLRDDSALPALVQQGLAGIEAYHCEHSPAVTEHYMRLARTLGVIATGGSDSHGPWSRRPVAIGSVHVPDELLDALGQAAGCNGRAMLRHRPAG